MISIQPVIGGHGEVPAIRILLQKLVPAAAPGIPFRVLRPWRTFENQIFNRRWIEFDKAASFARASAQPAGLLVLLDTDRDPDRCPAAVAPDLLMEAGGRSNPIPVRIVLAKSEFESWFLAAAESLTPGLVAPPDVESIRDAKGAVARLLGRPYDPVANQASLAERFDMGLARRRSPSFDKLWRDVESLVRELDARNPPATG